mgnify:CR=1 FL=1
MIIVLDGVDATGKSTLSRKIAGSIGARTIGEFSDSDLGNLITKIIEHERFFSLSKSQDTGVADFFTILADAVLKYEVQGARRDETVLMDRGLVSAFGYQLFRLGAISVQMESKELVRMLQSFIETSVPSVATAVHINLEVSRDAMQARVVERGEVPLSEPQIEALLGIQDAMREIGSAFGAIQIDTSGKSLDQVASSVARSLDGLGMRFS